MEAFKAAYEAVVPQLPTISVFASIVLSALFPIYTGAHASLSRPASAAPRKKKQDDTSDAAEDDDEEEEERVMESLSALDAVLFPVIAACVLATLYWLIKRFGARIINLIMSWYLASAGVLSVMKLFSDGTALALSFVLPTVYGYQNALWTVRATKDRSAFEAITDGKKTERESPLPAALGTLSIPVGVQRALWRFRRLVKQKYAFSLPRLIATGKVKVTVLEIASGLLGLSVVIYSNFVHNYWWLTNIQGFAVSYFALQMMSPTSFAIGSLVLSGLFVYDIWAVFFTPLMVTVATELDQPIKLVFPRYDTLQEDKALQFSMLGLGDIVLPGLLIGLCLRFDLYMYYLKQQSKPKDSKTVVKAHYTPARGQWANWFWTSSLPRNILPAAVHNISFPRPYFYASLIGYTIGLSVTLAIVAVYNHAQPALLYLVPSVLASCWGTGLIRGELKQMWEYSEEITADAHLDKKSDKERLAVSSDAAKDVDESPPHVRDPQELVSTIERASKPEQGHTTALETPS